MTLHSLLPSITFVLHRDLCCLHSAGEFHGADVARPERAHNLYGELRVRAKPVEPDTRSLHHVRH